MKATTKEIWYYIIGINLLFLCGVIPYLNLILFIPLAFYYSLQFYKKSLRKYKSRFISILAVWFMLLSIIIWIMSAISLYRITFA
ncbi:MAG: hypothetical protein ACMXYG_01320 [Candidatus Woesearchaeota archaeon]